MQSSIELLNERLQSLFSIVEEERIRFSVVKESKLNAEISAEDKKKINVVLLQVVDLFKVLGGESESELLEKINRFVSYALVCVFGDSYKFVSKMSVDGKDVKVDFYIRQREAVVDIVDACGGGVAEVVGLFLQIFFIVMGKGLFAPLLVLDTALVNLSDTYVRNMSKLLYGVAHKADIQLIFITHECRFEEFADVSYLFKQEDGRTIVNRIK